MFCDYGSVPKEAIPESEDNFPRCGVYFLMHEDEVVYVGQSVSIDNRIKQHRKDKTFDYAKAVKVDQNKLLMVESNFIVTMQPKYNRTLKWTKQFTTEDIVFTDVRDKAFENYSKELREIIRGTSLPLAFSQFESLDVPCSMQYDQNENELKKVARKFATSIVEFLRANAQYGDVVRLQSPIDYSINLADVIDNLKFLNTVHSEIFYKDIYDIDATIKEVESLHIRIREAERKHFEGVFEFA